MIPNTKDILMDEDKFIRSGEISPFLLWFKTKVMKVTPRTWQPFWQCPYDYYRKCTVIDKATGLWVIHFKYGQQQKRKKKKIHGTDDSTLTSEGINESAQLHTKYDNDMVEEGSVLVLATVTAVTASMNAQKQ